jgi:tetratricopeptide (TPR) repeat protein
LLKAAAFTLTVILAITGCTTSPAKKEAVFLDKGKGLRAKGEHNRAILEFRNAAKVMPKDAEPYYQLGLTYVVKQDMRTAFAMFTKAAGLNPKHVGTQLQLATFQIIGSVGKKELLGEAQSRIETVLASAPDNANALQLRAITEYRLGHTEAAERDLQRALEKSPAHLRSSISLANLKLVEKDQTGAESILQKAVQSDPKSGEAALAVAGFYLKIGRKSDAESEAKRAMQLDPKNASALRLLATLQVDAGQTADAEQTYRQISRLPDQSFKPLYAVFLFQQKKRDEAISELRRLVKENPDDREIRRLLVSAYTTTDRPEEAKRILTEALNRNSKDVGALLQRSEFYLAQQKYREAEQDLQLVLHFKPDSAEAHYGLAKVHASRQEQPQQKQELGETLRLDPKFLAARIDVAKLLLAKDSKIALTILDEAPDWQKKTLPYITARNGILLSLKDYMAARQGLDAALAIARTPEVLYQDAALRYEQKDYAGARRSLEDTLKQNVDNMLALNLLAQTYSVQGDRAKALSVVQQYAAQKPASPYLGSLVGIWQAQTGHLPQARQAFLDVISANPGYSPARVALANVDMAMGNVDEGRRTLKDVLGKEPGNRDALWRLAEIELKAGNRSAARDYFAAIVQTDSNNAEALNDLAYLLSDDKPDEALRYAQTAVELAPEAAAAHDTLGWVYYRKGIYPSALNSFKVAVGKEPTAVRQYHLALAYAKTGDPQRAREHLTAALKLDPNLPMPEPLSR